jgi:septum formation protein
VLGIEFRVVVSGVDEGADPVRNARAKALDVAERVGVPPGGAVLGCDTEVVRDGVALGKPADAPAARRMVGSLAGRDHEVRSAITLITDAGTHERLSVTRVRMRSLSPAALDWYVGTGEWRERAGGYAIQGAGAALIEGIDGDYSGVVGLPLPAVVDALGAAGLAPWS